MSRWISKITNAGLQLLARTPNNNFVFTRAECGSGTVDTSLLEEQIAVTDFKKTLLISSCTNSGDQVNLRVQLNNTDVAVGFYLYQVGIYAKLSTDSSDVLFMIIQTELADFIPSATESPNYVCDYVINTVISNAATITANVDPAGYVTQGQLEEILAGLEDVELKDNVTQIKQQIGATNDAQSSSTTTGSIFAKLNYLVSKMVSVYSWCSSMYSWLNNIYPKIGATTDTGGTTSAGTIMAKENAILTEVNKIGATSDTGGTATTGTVSAKVNALFNEVKQANDRIVTDNDIIKACTNYKEFKLTDLPTAETEILNISGEGFVSKISTYSSIGNTTTIKVYIDGELLFHFGFLGSSGVIGKSLFFGSASAAMFGNISRFLNGNTTNYGSTNNVYYEALSELLYFKESLRVVACSTIADTSNYVLTYYGLKG